MLILVLLISKFFSANSLCHQVTYDNQTYTVDEEEELAEGCKTRHVFARGDEIFCLSNDEEEIKSAIACDNEKNITLMDKGVTSDKIESCNWDCRRDIKRIEQDDQTIGSERFGKYKKRDKDIFGGKDEKEANWHVALIEKGLKAPFGIDCGGTLITTQTVLTAAHCMIDDYGEKVKLYYYEAWVGLLDVNKQEDVFKQELRKIVLHPDFTFHRRKASANVHDLAILTIDPVDIRKYQPVCLPTNYADAFAGICAKTTGWGYIDPEEDEPQILQGLLQRTLTNADCAEFLDPGTITDERICFSNVKHLKACSGDSGGPLVFTFKDKDMLMTLLIGVFSFGPSDCNMQLPTVYTRVSKYMEWIINESTGEKPPMCGDKHQIFEEDCIYCC